VLVFNIIVIADNDVYHIFIQIYFISHTVGAARLFVMIVTLTRIVTVTVTMTEMMIPIMTLLTVRLQHSTYT
jgi:hypothetical protein